MNGKRIPSTSTSDILEGFIITVIYNSIIVIVDLLSICCQDHMDVPMFEEKLDLPLHKVSFLFQIALEKNMFELFRLALLQDRVFRKMNPNRHEWSICFHTFPYNDFQLLPFRSDESIDNIAELMLYFSMPLIMAGLRVI